MFGLLLFETISLVSPFGNNLGKLCIETEVIYSSVMTYTVLRYLQKEPKNPYFAKHLFAKQELIARARLPGQDFATGKNFSFNQCHAKSFAFFSRESYFIKAIENFFPVFT